MPLEEIAALFGDRVVTHIDGSGHVQVTEDEKGVASLQIEEAAEIEHPQEATRNQIKSA